MPINVGYFKVRQPRVSSNNAITTSAPETLGTFSLLDAFEISYTGTASICTLYITGTRIQSICDENHLHPDNLNIQLTGRTIQSTVDEFGSAYSISLVTSRLEDAAFLEGVHQFDLKASSYLVRYNTQKEYIVDVHTRGEVAVGGTAKVNSKTEEFTFKGEINRWSINEGKIHDEIGLEVPSSGEVEVGGEGVFIKFKPSFSQNSIDLENTVNFNGTELVRLLDQPLSSTLFPPAPLSVDGTLSLSINQETVIEGKDFVVDYGDKPAITASNFGPYTFTLLNNTLKVRWNSDDVQQVIFPTGQFTANQVANFINLASLDHITALTFTNEQNQSFLVLAGTRGTLYHQLRVEDGTANTLFGFQNFQAKKGSGIGQLHFMTYVSGEEISPTVVTDSLIVNAINTASDNPFLGVDTANFELSEDGLLKTQGTDYLVDGGGTVNLISRITSESLVDSVLKIDSDLFAPSYIIYENGVPLVEGEDYDINPQGGWITLTESAFPGRVFTATYLNSIFGKIEDEVILGGTAKIRGTKAAGFSFDSTNNIFKVSINGLPEQTFTFGLNTATTATLAALLINTTAVGFKCLICNNKLELESDGVGPQTTIQIGNGSANPILGFVENQSAEGFGASGGERSLEVKNAPMDVEGFTAPENGNIVIIKNNDVTSRYKADSIIKIGEDYYQVYGSYLEDRANLISTVSGPYTIIIGTNDVLKFSVNSEAETVVTIQSGSQVTPASIVNQINSVRPQTARVYNINGVDRIQLLASSSIVIGDGSAGRTLGFDEGSSDTSSSDTIIKIVGRFKTTYVSPNIATTVDPISFEEELSERIEVPQFSTSFLLVGDHTSKYKSNIFVRIGGSQYYKIIASTFDSGMTEVTLHNRLDVPVFTDTSIFYSILPIYEEGNVSLKSQKVMYLSEPHVIKKNGNILIQDSDYSISETGDIELTEGILFGDTFVLEYTSRRYLDPGTIVSANYSYFDFLTSGTNIKFSVQAINPDTFYINVLHGSTILGRTSDELTERTISNLGSGATGLPSGNIPTTENDESGVGNSNYTIGDLDDKIEVSLKVFEYYDDRIKHFEDEKKSMDGQIVGAEDGRVTVQQIIDSATLAEPQRLFPFYNISPSNQRLDTRPFEERTMPLRIPALDGFNQNDDVVPSSANGLESSYLIQKLGVEKTQDLNEISRLEYLRDNISISSSSLVSTGPISNLDGGEQIILYVERKSGSSLIQRTVTVSMPGPDDSGPSTIYPSANWVAAAIDQAVNIAFGTSSLNLASGGFSGPVTLSVNSSNIVCCYVIQDNAKVGFGVGNEASVRSRHTFYTAGSTYSATVPGSSSVHLDIVSHNATRAVESTHHNDQIIALEGQMLEWLEPYVTSFVEAKEERARVYTALNEADSFTISSNDFQDIKQSDIFNSIDDTNTINDRISALNIRVFEIDRRLAEITARLSSISASLNRENLYTTRYSWVVLLADKSTGYYASRSREISEEIRRQNTAANNLDAVLGLQSLF